MNQNKGEKVGKPSKLYIDGFPGEAKARYLEKIKVIDDIDPYSMKFELWKSDESELPPIGYEDVDYLLVRKSAYTQEQFKAIKSLNADNQVTSGWVHNVVTAKAKSANIVVSLKVYHSQRLSGKPLQPWVIADTTGCIISAHCNCMAGLGEACSHVASLLFTVDITCESEIPPQ